MLNVSEVNAERSSETLPERASARFSEMLISPYMKERLAAARFTTPTPVQAAAIPQALEGKDVLATAQTGTGKTLALLIPVIERLLKDKTPGIAALVLVPTRELAMQVVDQFNKLRGNQLLPAALVVGGLAEGGQLQAIRKGARLVVATPGRHHQPCSFANGLELASLGQSKRSTVGGGDPWAARRLSRSQAFPF